MRPAIGLGIAVLVVLAGCSLPSGDTTTTAPEVTTSTETTPAETTTSDDGTATDDDTPTTTDTPSEMVDSPPDPESDRLGWEAGLWYNETISVDNSDGMNKTERTLAVARSMARVEHVRQLEFPGNETIPIDVISRTEFRNQSIGTTEYTDTYRLFDDVKFEALLFVGENNDSIDVQEANRGSSVLGYYSPANKSIVLISEGDLPTFDGEETLAQEVAHALQDARFNISEMRQTVRTRDSYNGQNGVIEGDGNLIDELYVEECETNWDCIPAPEDGSGPSLGSDFNFGIYFMEFLPYSDGPGFIRYYYNRGGWDRIDEMYASPPQSAEQVIFPSKYETDPPTEVSLSDRTAGGWERIRPEPQRPGGVQPDYDTLGQSALSAMFMRTAYTDYGSSPVVSQFEFLNIGEDGVNMSDPLNYGLDYTNGWEGDRIHIYHNEATGEDGYVWKLRWENATEAGEFVSGYEQLLAYWGGEQVSDGRYVVESGSPFADAFAVTVEGDTVTIVNAPTIDQLGDVYTPVAG